MSKLWASGQSLTVWTDDDDLPVAFLWRDARHQVAGIAKRWRVDEGWWRWQVWREYFKLYTDSGLLVLIYRDLLHNDWYLQRLYD